MNKCLTYKENQDLHLTVYINLQVIAVQPGDTTVTRNGANAVSLKEGQGTEFSFTDQTVPSYITCSQACSVALYTLQDNTGNYAGSIQFPLVPKDFFVR